LSEQLVPFVFDFLEEGVVHRGAVYAAMLLVEVFEVGAGELILNLFVVVLEEVVTALLLFMGHLL